MAAVPKFFSISKTQMLATARVMYEVQGISQQNIADQAGVSLGAVRKWKQQGKWATRGAELAKIEELTRLRTLKILSDKGMPPERAIDLLIEGMTQPMTDQILKPIIDEKTKKVKRYDIEFAGFPNYKIRQQFLHDYLSIVGLIGSASAVQVNNSGGGTINLQVNIPPKDEE